MLVLMIVEVIKFRLVWSRIIMKVLLYILFDGGCINECGGIYGNEIR